MSTGISIPNEKAALCLDLLRGEVQRQRDFGRDVDHARHVGDGDTPIGKRHYRLRRTAQLIFGMRRDFGAESDFVGLADDGQIANDVKRVGLAVRYRIRQAVNRRRHELNVLVSIADGWVHFNLGANIAVCPAGC